MEFYVKLWKESADYQLMVKYADITFEVGNLLIKANKYFLATQSAYFDKLFDYESGPIIKLNGFNPEVFEYIILSLTCNDGALIHSDKSMDYLEQLVACIAMMDELMLYYPKLFHIKLYLDLINNFSDFLTIRPYLSKKIMNDLNPLIHIKLSSYLKDKRNKLDFESLVEIFDLDYLIKVIPLKIIKQDHIKYFDRRGIKSSYSSFLTILFQRWIPCLNRSNLLEHLLKQLTDEDNLSQFLTREELIIDNIKYLKFNLIEKFCYSSKFCLPIQYRKLYYIGHDDIYQCYDLDIVYYDRKVKSIKEIYLCATKNMVKYKNFQLGEKAILNICYLYRIDSSPSDDQYYPILNDY